MDAPLEFLHVIDHDPGMGAGEDYSGAIGFNAQENLLTQLSSQDEVRGKAAREQGRIFLNNLRERAIAAGTTSVDIRQRRGELEVTLAEQEKMVRLFVLGRRGESAEITKRDLGRNIERLVRALNKPILTVTEAFREPRRVMIAFDGGIITRRGVEMVAASPLFRGLPVHLLMSGKESQDAPKQLDWAKTTLEAAGFEAPTALIPGDAENVIAKSVQEMNIDILIMGAYANSPLHRLLFGSKTSDLLRSSKIPTLLLR
jgi:nucleotide-binding universal stress UspA family protein